MYFLKSSNLVNLVLVSIFFMTKDIKPNALNFEICLKKLELVIYKNKRQNNISKASLGKSGIIILFFWKIDVKPNRPFHLQ